MKQYPRVLVISNECISNVSSNGRTLRNFFEGWPKEKIAQFCIHNTEPDATICENYYYVSDRDALQALLKGNKPSGEMPQAKMQSKNVVGTGRRNPLTMLMRNFVWNSNRWAGKCFYNWIEEFNPELVLLQAGDSAFMLNLARRLATRHQIPLVIYNSEAYYFKKFDFFRSAGIAKLFYPIFRAQYCRAFKKCIKAAHKSIYCCDKLNDDYVKEFHLPSEVIYTVTQIEHETVLKNGDDLKISYLGNLGVGRHEGLIEIGEVLQHISPKLKLDVYGRIPNRMVQNAFEQCKGIEYKGFVSYKQVVDIIKNSDILIHTESFTEYYKEDLKYAFSTKIADSLASGTCFMLYAPKGMACTEYLIKHNAAWVISEKTMLQPTLEHLCGDADIRDKYVENALRLVKNNHSPLKNTERFQKILCDSLKED